MTLHKKDIASILHLEDNAVLGDILESLVACYQNAGYNRFYDHITLPNFLKIPFGPPLDQLPSNATLDQKHTNLEMVARRENNMGIKGIGEIMDAIHGDMRRIGGKTGRLFAPSMADIVPSSHITGPRFDPEKAQALRQYNSATIQLKDNEPSLEVVHPEIRYFAFMLAAEARSHVSRTAEEKHSLRQSVGTLKNSFIATCHLLSLIEEALKKSPQHAGKTLEDYGLIFNIEKAITAFYQRQKEFSELYPFLYVATAGKLDTHLQDLKWAIEGRGKPADGIDIRSAADAASVLFAICAWLSKTDEATHQLCERMALAGNPRNAAILLEQSEILETLERALTEKMSIVDAAITDEPNANTPVDRQIPIFVVNAPINAGTPEPYANTTIPYDFLLQMITILRNFQSQHIALGDWQDRNLQSTAQLAV